MTTLRNRLPRIFLALVFALGLLGTAGIAQRTSLSAPPAYASLPGQRFLVVHDATDVGGELGWSNLRTAMNLAHLEYDVHDLNVTTTLPALGDYSAVITMTELLWKLPGEQALALKDYVAGGGHLAVLYRGWNRVLREVFGVYNRRDPEYAINKHAVVFDGDLFPGVQGILLPELPVGRFSGLSVLLTDNPIVIARSDGDNHPVIWRNSFGEGEVIYWNNDWAAIKEFRGYLIQSILSILPVGGQAIANWATLQIDDFPNASSTARLEPITSEYNLRYVDWLYQHWYPDVTGLSRKYGLPLTWYPVFNYNATVKPPFDFREWANATIEINDQQVLFGPFMASQVRRGLGEEVGLHGYNHISLLTAIWGSEDNMLAALTAADERWRQDGFGDPPRTYVPPNNMYDMNGVTALHTVFPSIRAIAGINTGSFEEGGDREFGPEPLNPTFYELPRWTDGYRFDDSLRWGISSEVGMFGVWTHFIHPDDVINIPLYYPFDPLLRNPDSLPWRGDSMGRHDGLYYQLDSILNFVTENYPWLHFVTTYESFLEMERYDASRASFHVLASDQMAVTFTGSPTPFQIRLNDGRRIDLNSVSGARFVALREGDGYVIYVFEGTADTAQMRLLFPQELP